MKTALLNFHLPTASMLELRTAAQLCSHCFKDTPLSSLWQDLVEAQRAKFTGRVHDGCLSLPGMTRLEQRQTMRHLLVAYVHFGEFPSAKPFLDAITKGMLDASDITLGQELAEAGIEPDD